MTQGNILRLSRILYRGPLEVRSVCKQIARRVLLPDSRVEKQRLPLRKKDDTVSQVERLLSNLMVESSWLGFGLELDGLLFRVP